MQYSIYITGVGGQGVVKTSIVIGYACIKKGLNVVTSEIHGMSQRGGVVPVEVRIGEVNGPIIKSRGADLLLAFEPLEALRSLPKINRNTFAVVNTSEIIPFTSSLGLSQYAKSGAYIEELKKFVDIVIPLDADGIAKRVGSPILSNMVILGAGAASLHFPIEKEYIEDAIKEAFKPQFVALNIKAFNEGYALGRSMLKC